MSWFYFDVPKKEAHVSEECVAQHTNISQIPMIGNNEELIDSDQQYQRPLFRPTDSKYIMLCKMGGRQDLLTMKDRKTTSDNPVAYPRCDWFYLEDNAEEDRVNHEDVRYISRQPDYMVYDYDRRDIPKGVGIRPRERYPYAFNAETSNKLEIRIPEPKKFGYGVRDAKHRAKVQRANQGTTLPSIHANVNGRQRLATQESQPTMGKLMSNHYCK